MLINIFKKIIKFILFLIIIPWVLYFIFAYKDLIFSFGAKKTLEGKMVYSLRSLSSIDIKVIDFPSGKKRNIYASIPRGGQGYLGYINSFSFSRDGSKIVFSKMGTAAENYRFKLYTMNSDGTTIKDLLDLEGVNAEYPSWSPDDKKVAFIEHKPYDEGGLYVINVDKPYSSLKKISNIQPAFRRLHWSPDEKKISFISDEYIRKRINATWRSEAFAGKSFVINNDGTGLRQLRANKPVSWSPDGRMLLYRKKDGYYISDENELYTYLLIPYKRPSFSMLVEDPSFAVWSPDGKYIAYVKEIWPGGCGLGIYIVSVDNSAKEICIAVEKFGITEMVWVK